MAESGDPQTSDDHDDLIGFTSPSSLAGAERRPEPRHAAADADDEGDDLFDDLPVHAVATPEPEIETDVAHGHQSEVRSEADDLGPLFSEPPRFSEAARAVPDTASVPGSIAPVAAADLYARTPDVAPITPPPASVATTPDWARETLRTPRAEPAAFGRSRRLEPPQGAMGLYAVYALILFAVPTLGVSAFIGLFAVTGRPAPDQPLALSHFRYQQRTLWIAAVSAVLGVVLIAVNLGVFVLFIVAVWVLIRGSVGVVRLASGQPIANPDTLLI
jgi:uncharacterized membrane protein